MNWSTFSPAQLAGGQIALAAILAVVGFTLLLPRPRGRSVPGGIAALIAAVAVFAAYLYTRFGDPMPDVVGSILFWMFSAGALIFGTVLVTQANPARGAIAFAFVILSTCGLFLLLAATFLMAVTIIVYAGAIIVTFLFVLMLSQTKGPSDENDRSREPLFGSLAGFAFTGLVLFAVYLTALENQAKSEDSSSEPLPVMVLTTEERQELLDVIAELDRVSEPLDESFKAPAGTTEKLAFTAPFDGIQKSVVQIERSIRQRVTKYRNDPQGQAVLARADAVIAQNDKAYDAVLGIVFRDEPGTEAQKQLRTLRDELRLLASSTDLPARNVANIGYALYSTHLLAVELAGTLLLVATIGATVIAQRKGAVA